MINFVTADQDSDMHGEELEQQQNSVPSAIFWHHSKLFLCAGFGLLVILIIIAMNYFIVGSYGKYILHDTGVISRQLNQIQTVGVVFGGGVENGQPRPLLKDRLDTAAKLLKGHTVRKLIVSGDNRFEDYNEPKVMQDYLVRQHGIDPELVQQDNAGRSTYETCERAKKIFGLDKALLISESTHLPRAIYLCRSFGIEAYGYKSDGQASHGLQVGQRFREIAARTKATINIYILGERTVLGQKIKT